MCQSLETNLLIVTFLSSLDGVDYLVNLIDSPGHVDFCGEVSTAVRLCDGAMIVIDVIEGICAQTKTAIRQAWIERLKPILVLNKIDRLIIERKLAPIDAHVLLQQILEQVNALMGELFTAERIGREEEETEEGQPVVKKNPGRDQAKISNDGDPLDEWDEEDDSNIYFSPEQGNVIFASALDGWGFTIQNFSEWVSKKLGFKKEILDKTLWGDFFVNSKTQRIMKGAQAKAKKPLFVSMILENIWNIYEYVMIRKDSVMVEKIVKSLNITLTKRDLSHSDSRMLLQSIFTQWLSLAPNLLAVICDLVPSPLELNEARAEKLMCSHTTRFDFFPPETQKIKEAFVKCSPDGPKIVCISKMFPVERSALPQHRYRPLTEEEIAMRRQLVKASAIRQSRTLTILGENSIPSTPMIDRSDNKEEDEDEDEKEGKDIEEIVFLAFARVFSGTLKKGDKLYVLHPKHDPSKLSKDTVIDANAKLVDLKSDQHITIAEIQNLYLLMGRSLDETDEVQAGNVVGISGLEEHVIKSATLSDSIFCPSFIDPYVASQPILRVAIEPQKPADMTKLIKGLKLLNQSDPCVEVKIQTSGEHVIVTTGEIHLQKCVDDLVNKFAGIEVNVSSPIVPFRETVINEVNSVSVSSNPHVIKTSNATNSASATSREEEGKEDDCRTKDSNADDTNTSHLHSDIDSEGYLTIATPNKKSTIKVKAAPIPPEVVKLLEENANLIRKVDEIRKNRKTTDLSDVVPEVLRLWQEFRDKLREAFSESDSPWIKETDSFDRIWSFGPQFCGPNILVNLIDNFSRNIWQKDSDNVAIVDKSDPRNEYEFSFINGFQMATLSGPLAEEPMLGVAFIIKDWTMIDQSLLTDSDPYGPFTGQIMATVKDGCRKAFQHQPQRLMAAMYSCTIQVTSDALGKWNNLLFCKQS